MVPFLEFHHLLLRVRQHRHQLEAYASTKSTMFGGQDSVAG